MEGVTRSSVLTLEVGAGELRGRPGGAEHILQGEVGEFHWKLASCRHEALATVPLDGQRASNNIGVRRERGERGRRKGILGARESAGFAGSIGEHTDDLARDAMEQRSAGLRGVLRKRDNSCRVVEL